LIRSAYPVALKYPAVQSVPWLPIIGIGPPLPNGPVFFPLYLPVPLGLGNAYRLTARAVRLGPDGTVMKP
jgi:hypothetical protein